MRGCKKDLTMFPSFEDLYAPRMLARAYEICGGGNRMETASACV